jgi:DNA-3-methyladenine glycosylase II
MGLEPSLQDALDHIKSADESFHKVIPLATRMRDRRRPEGFDVLTKIIIEQQVSLASSEAIWKRMSAAIDPFTPEKVLTFNEDGLRELGLSRQKAKYCRCLALDIAEQRLDLMSLRQMDDEEIQNQLTQVKGIGRWTAEIYMITSLERLDIWPAGDIALQSAMQHLKGLQARPYIDEMDMHAEPLRPYRTVAARLLWCYYSEIMQAQTQKKS